MSTWTHINASIRFDGVLGMPLPNERELGDICRWEDENTDHWDTTLLPCGSEGSLQYEIIRNPDPDCLAAMVVVFYGDLRDYDDVTYILEYFHRITKGKMIRSGILEISVGQDNLTYFYSQDTEEWVQTIA